MKKGVATGLAALLITSSFAPAALADESESSREEENKGNDSEETEESESLIDTLTLDDAVDQALSDNSNLLLMEYRVEDLQSQLDGTEDDHRDIEDDLDEMEDEMDDLRDVQSETGESTFQARYEIQQQMEELEDTFDDIEDSIEQLNSNEVTLEYDRQEAEESTKLSTTSTFTQLVMTNDQLEFMKDSLDTEKERVKNTEQRYEVGLASRNDVETDQRELTRLESEIEQTSTELENDMAVFASEIGITYHSDLQLEELNVDEVELVEQETDTDNLIEDSFNMKSAKEELELAEYERERTHDDDDAESFDREQADIAVKTEEENISQLKTELTNTIEELYTDVSNEYEAVTDAEQELDYANEDYEDLKLQLDAGMVSEAEYDLSHTEVEQAELDYTSAKQNYFLITKQVDALEAGVIQTGGSSEADAGESGSAQGQSF